jgi:glucan phosphoethanolaminetransferase (alkaline phosphatase superfamily)
LQKEGRAMSLLTYSPYLFGVLLFWLCFEWYFYEKKHKVRTTGIILRLALFVVGAMVIVHFTLKVYNGQFKKHNPVRPAPVEAVWT